MKRHLKQSFKKLSPWSRADCEKQAPQPAYVGSEVREPPPSLGIERVSWEVSISSSFYKMHLKAAWLPGKYLRKQKQMVQ